MLIAKKTAYLRSDGDYESCCKRGKSREWYWFVCGKLLWKTFPISGPEPNAIRIELHDTPAKDRVEIVNSPRKDHIYFDGVEYRAYVAGDEWLQPYLKKYGTVYAEVWY